MKCLKNCMQCVYLTMMLILILTNVSMATECDILVVMGFQEGFFRTEEIRQGIEETLQGTCNVQYVYLNALSDPQNIEKRAQEAYAVFQEIQPDGVIAARDEAQTYFVVPYLKDQVDIPIIFCDINEPPETFGYPTDQITGITGRLLIDRTILFAQQIDPNIRTIGTLFAKEAAAEAIVKQIRTEGDTYTAKVLEPSSYVTTYAEAIAMTETLKDQCDALLIGPIGMLLFDSAGNPVPMQTFVTEVAEKNSANPPCRCGILWCAAEHCAPSAMWGRNTDRSPRRCFSKPYKARWYPTFRSPKISSGGVF